MPRRPLLAPFGPVRSMLFVPLLVIALAGCGEAAAPGATPPAVTVAPALARDIVEWDEFPGRIEPVEVVEVRPRVGGVITRVAFEDGAVVPAGAVLFQVDTRPYEAALTQAAAERARANARMQLATSELERAQRLLQVQAMSREEYDLRRSVLTEAEAQWQAAGAAVESARLHLEWTTVRAPIGGRVSRASVTAGNLVQPGMPGEPPLTTVVSLDPVYVAFEADEGTFLRHAGLSARQSTARVPVRVALTDEPDFPHEGILVFTDNRIDPATGTLPGRAKVPNASGRLVPGLYARVRLRGAERPGAVLVQDGAIGTDQDRKFVLVVGPGDTVAYRQVQLGRLVDGLRVIRTGLAAGERVVITGLQRVRPGMQVQPTVVAMVADSSIVATR